MNKSRLLGAVCACLTMVSNNIYAAIVFDNGGVDQITGIQSDFDKESGGSGQQIANEFTLSSGNNTINGIEWSGVYNNSTNTASLIDNFTVRIFSDAGETPDTLPLYSFNVGNAVNRTDSLMNISNGLDIYNYSTTFGSTTLTAGANYWLSIVANTAGDSAIWLWATSDAYNYTGSYRGNDGVGWVNDLAGEVAFKLTYSAVPIPPTLVTIDIKPSKKTDVNVIDLKKDKNLKVAIVGSYTFDALSVDPATVLFGVGSNKASPIRFKGQDYNRDGYSDLILTFKLSDTDIACGVTEATLTGQTDTDPVVDITGSDSFTIKGCQ